MAAAPYLGLDDSTLPMQSTFDKIGTNIVVNIYIIQ